ncbi:MAG: MATE family efflux transporter [Solobacterium sp.]|nr:MATE family efflux transporter [Solobacterium sp.]
MVMLKAREGFLNELLVLIIPIILQNLITSAVSMADVIMLGRVDQVSLSASSLASQVQFLLNIVYFGLASALTILASQYWGRKDGKTVSKIFGIGLIISMFFSSLAALGAFFLPHVVIRFWTNIGELAEAGSVYLRFAAASYLFSGITQPYLAIMKSCERVKKATFISITTFLLNVVLNAVLIFGLLGMPRMGISGAALATSLSRGAELLLCAADFRTQEIIRKRPSQIFSVPGELVSDFARYCLPAFINDAVWALAYNMNSVIMGHLGSDITAAASIVGVARDLVTTVGFGISAAAAIMLGNEIGEGRTDIVKQDADSILRLCLIVCVFQGLVLLALTPVIPGFVKITDTAAGYMRIMLMISTVYQLGQVINTVLIASIFRCGGDAGFGLRLDIVSMWFVTVPLALLSAFVFRHPVMVVYMFMCTDEFFKLPFAVRHYLKGTWINDLTREF